MGGRIRRRGPKPRVAGPALELQLPAAPHPPFLRRALGCDFLCHLGRPCRFGRPCRGPCPWGVRVWGYPRGSNCTGLRRRLPKGELKTLRPRRPRSPEGERQTPRLPRLPKGELRKAHRDLRSPEGELQDPRLPKGELRRTLRLPKGELEVPRGATRTEGRAEDRRQTRKTRKKKLQSVLDARTSNVAPSEEGV